MASLSRTEHQNHCQWSTSSRGESNSCCQEPQQVTPCNKQGVSRINSTAASPRNNGNDDDSLPFPDAHSIPFPYPTPYPQQVDLMHTLLETLRLKEEQQEQEQQQSGDKNGGPTSKNPQQKHASVLFLESPTGTGKSLSLASAACAWLQYREAKDLMTEETATKDDKDEPEKSWWDAWVPAEQRQREQDIKDMKLSAKMARDELNGALAKVRTAVNKSQTSQSLASSSSSPREALLRRRQHVLRDQLNQVRSQPRSRTKQSKKAKTTATTIKGRENQHDKGKDEFCLDDYHSDTESPESQWMSDQESDDDHQTSSHMTWKRNLSQAGKLLQGARLDGSQRIPLERNKTSAPGLPPPLPSHTSASDATTVGQVVPGSGTRKIVYAARTHSQLSQFVHELDKLLKQHPEQYQNIRVVALGGRPALCGHPTLSKKSEAVLNETCLDWQQGKRTSNSCATTPTTKGGGGTQKKRATSSSSTSGCPLLSDRDAVDTLALHLLSEPTDIEDAASLGKSTQSCSYYASRTALQAAHVVVLPYSMLFSSQARTAVGLHLEKSLVLVDEAHNVPEALRQVHSCQLSLEVVKMALEQLSNYVSKYRAKLASRNIHYLGQLKKILMTLQKAMLGKIKNIPDTMITGTELILLLRLENTNLFKILTYLNESRLPQKLLGFTNHRQAELQEQQQSGKAETENVQPAVLSKHISAMSVFQTFLEKLILTNQEGKFLLQRPAAASPQDAETFDSAKDAQFRFVLLKPALFLQDVLQQAHAVALVGGTLQPFSHVAAELLPTQMSAASEADQTIRQQQQGQRKPPSTTDSHSGSSYSFLSPSFSAFSCDHVVSSKNVLLQCWADGPKGAVRLDFRHSQRFTHLQCDNLGSCLLQICDAVLQGGIIIFLPSYSYQSFLMKRWSSTGLWAKLQAKKKLYREPKRSQEIESTLESYGKDAKNNNALLFSVIGGKMSEGINFSNEMARCVVVVGLPYPDVTDPILKEKMSSMDQVNNPCITGKAYYHNLCMRAVNQSVGRAIRHANDYAAILLLDQRYHTDSRVWSRLPNWLKGDSVDLLGPLSNTFEQRIDEMKSFFNRKS